MVIGSGWRGSRRELIENRLCAADCQIRLAHPAVEIGKVELLLFDWRKSGAVCGEWKGPRSIRVFSRDYGFGRAVRRPPATAPGHRSPGWSGFIAQRRQMFQSVKPAFRPMRHLNRDAARDEHPEQRRCVFDGDAETAGERGRGDDGRCRHNVDRGRSTRIAPPVPDRRPCGEPLSLQHTQQLGGGFRLLCYRSQKVEGPRQLAVPAYRR
jgi:hypothetical protein